MFFMVALESSSTIGNPNELSPSLFPPPMGPLPPPLFPPLPPLPLPLPPTSSSAMMVLLGISKSSSSSTKGE